MNFFERLFGRRSTRHHAENSHEEQWSGLYKKEQWNDLYIKVWERREMLAKWNSVHVKVYKHLGYILSLSAPLLAATVTYLATQKDKTSIFFASVFGLLLTFFTVLGGVLKPAQRFLAAVQLAHELEEFKTDFEIDLRKLSTENPPKLDKIFTILHTRNRQLSVVGEAMAMGTLSTGVSEGKKRQEREKPLPSEESH